MYVNKPASVPQLPPAEHDPARAENAAGTPVGRQSAAHAPAQGSHPASASNPLASAAAAAVSAGTSSAAIARVPLHGLGPSSAAADHFVPALDHDVMSVIGGYLGNSEKLEIRSISETLHKGIDKSIDNLHVKPAEVMALFKDGNTLPNLRKLTLDEWTADDLLQLAQVVRSVKQPPFELCLIFPLSRYHDLQESATFGLEHTVSMKLSTLSLHRFAMASGLANALMNAPFPIVLDAYVHDDAPDYDIHPIAQMPTIVALTLALNYPSDLALSDSAASAMQSHPTLRQLTCKQFMPGQLQKVLANPALEYLSFEDIIEETDEAYSKAFTALSEHPKLTSLTLGNLQAAGIETLSRSTTIHTLSIYIGYDALQAVSCLGQMPALRDLTLRMDTQFNGRNFGPQLSASDIQTVCAKPLDSLDLYHSNLDQTALGAAVSANARHISFGWHSGEFDQAAISALVANPHVSSLIIYANCEAPGASMARLAASPTITHLNLNITTTTDTKDSITAAWLSAGKPLVDLQCFIRL